MIIIYDKANTLTLPYGVGKQVKYVKFVPGTNEVKSDIWELIKKHNEVRFEYYERFLHALSEEASTDEGLDYNALNVKEVVTLMSNEMDVAKLEEYRTLEMAKEKPRVTILNDIDKQIQRITGFVDKVNGSGNDDE